MAGTRRLVTLAMDWIPPMMTKPTMPARMSPNTRAAAALPRGPSSPPVTFCAWAKVWLAWNMLPPAMPKAMIATAYTSTSARLTNGIFSLSKATFR